MGCMMQSGAQPPATELVPLLLAGKSRLGCAVRWREAIKFDSHRVERSSFRASVAPAGIQRLSRRAFSPTIVVKSDGCDGRFLQNRIVQLFLRRSDCSAYLHG
jgi:hypothetical protein